MPVLAGNRKYVAANRVITIDGRPFQFELVRSLTRSERGSFGIGLGSGIGLCRKCGEPEVASLDHLGFDGFHLALGRAGNPVIRTWT